MERMTRLVTRDPHLGKAMKTVRRHLRRPCNLVTCTASSGQFAESHPIPSPTYNALHLYRRKADRRSVAENLLTQTPLARHY
jgi:hypothetical protein